MFTSCGAAVSRQPLYNETAETTDIDVDTVENSDFRLTLDRTNYGVRLTSLSTGEAWGTTPGNDEDETEYDELGMPVTKHPQAESAVKVTYRNAESRTEDILLSYSDAVQDGNVSVEKIDNGFKAEYRFENVGIMIPVEYELLKDSVRISVDPTKIEEKENRVVSVYLAPFWTSAENDAPDSYLFVPSGSGTLIDVKTRSAGGLGWSGQVYGTDGTIEREIISTESKEIRLPVYGVKNGSSASFAVIESGEESAFIDTNAGSSQIGYSYVCARFQLRGYTNHIAKFFGASQSASMLYSAPMITRRISVLFYPLSGENANYSGMARTYRDYLDKEYGKAEKVNEKSLNVEFLGGKMITKSFLGIPYKTLSPLTTLKETEETVRELNKTLENDFQIQLAGYTDTGVDVGKVGGGFSLNRRLGSNKELKSLADFCKNNGIDAYMDYETVKFSKSGGGFSVGRDAAFNVGELKAVLYDYDIAAKSKDKDSAYYLLSPAKLTAAGEKLIKKVGNSPLSGISLATLSNTSYSDYKNKESTEYYSKSGMTDKAAEIFKAVAGSGKKLLSSDANLYAAVLSDAVVNTPICSSRDYSYTADIPFYAMVMKGRVPLYCANINMLSDAEDTLLHAMEGGMGIGYTVIEKWNNSLIDSQNIRFYNCVYSDIKNSITENAAKVSELLNKADGSAIKSHRILAGGVRETVFENGTTVYVNYGDTAAEMPHGEVKAHNYLVLEKLS